MDFQNRAGNKAGGGGTVSTSERNVDRRERMRLLALEITDINKDPYIMRNSIGSYECKLCMTIHHNEGNYLAHTQGKKHQSNLQRRQIKYNAPIQSNEVKKDSIKIGKPGYKITKLKSPLTNQKSLLFEIDYPEISKNQSPQHKIISSFEQKVEPVDSNYQYIVFAAEPYENIGVKIPNIELDYGEESYKVNWNMSKNQYSVLITFK